MKIIKSKKTYDILIDKFEFRSIPKNSVPTWDTVIINVNELKYREKIINILNTDGFRTKNLQMQWVALLILLEPCFDSKQISKSSITKTILRNLLQFQYGFEKVLESTSSSQKTIRIVKDKNFILAFIPARGGSKGIQKKYY